VIRGLAPEQLKNLILSVGTHRDQRPLSPTEVGDAIARAYAAGTHSKELTADLQLHDSTMLTRFLQLRKLSPNIKHLVDWGPSSAGIAFTTASELTRLPITDHETAARLILEMGITSSELRQVVQRQLRSHQSFEDSARDIVRLRQVTERRHVLIGSVAGTLRRHLEGMSQAARNQLLETALRDVAPPEYQVTCRLGPDRFALLGGDALATRLRSLEPDFETAINASLSAIVDAT
jgi:hypothetical protein